MCMSAMCAIFVHVMGGIKFRKQHLCAWLSPDLWSDVTNDMGLWFGIFL